MVPEVLDFRITAQCALRCPFCFCATAVQQMDMTVLRRFLTFMQAQGLKYVVLTGGEPTQSPIFKEVLEILQSLGLAAALSTNGLFWPDEELRSMIFSACQWISFPVESSIAEVHNHMRRCTLDHYSLIHSILEQIRSMAPGVKLKIGTVAAKENAASIPSLLDTLPVQPDVWRLFQLSRSEKNTMYYEKQHLDDRTFGDLIHGLKARYQEHPTKIQTSYDRERDGRYLFLEPDGLLKTIKDGQDFVIGQYADIGPDLIHRIETSVDDKRTNMNFFNSFGAPQ